MCKIGPILVEIIRLLIVYEIFRPPTILHIMTLMTIYLYYFRPPTISKILMGNGANVEDN